jgi:CHAD domain-containing protein
MSKALSNPTVKIFGAATLLRNLNAILQEVEGVRAAKDIEYIHRMRVATRRLRSGIDLFGPILAAKKYASWRRDIRGLTKALGAARDTDVQIENLVAFLKDLQEPQRAGVRRLMLRLRQRRAGYQQGVLTALDAFEHSHTPNDMVQKLAHLDFYREYVNPQNPALQLLACETIHQKLADFVSFEEAIQDPNNIAELHAMRIAAKHLRYTMEFFTGMFPGELKAQLKALRSCQDLLGSIHDCDVWVAWMPKFIQKERKRAFRYYGSVRPFSRLQPGLEYYLGYRKDERIKLYSEFIQAWDAWKAKGFWESFNISLAETILALHAREEEPEAPEGQPEEEGEEPRE